MMIVEDEKLHVAMGDLPALTLDEQDDAAFRARDRAWAAVVGLFDQYAVSQGLTYKSLGDRIGRKRSQVQRWLGSAFNINTASLGLLAEGLNADIIIELRPRVAKHWSDNKCHPSEEARAFVDQVVFQDISASVSTWANTHGQSPYVASLAK